MLLSPGARLGPYEIVAQIGAGGMGEVYRARDSRVGRDVALKICSGRLGERFEREARAIAALNHPNVCTLYDVGPDYLVMELVDGDAPEGPLPLQTALTYARQIAAALDAAHQKGIVHRDLKPGNIKITRDGTVKVLDFGLAKIVAPAPADGAPQSLTHSAAAGATHAGTILGTAAYMAPEQARGTTVDKRADIWSFGVVLYEMLTGRRPFEGGDLSTILAQVIQSEPSWNGVPASVRKLLESCLEKDPERRLRDIGDVWRLLDDGPVSRPRTRTEHAGWVAAGLLTIVAVLAVAAPWRGGSRPAAEPMVQLDVALGPDVSLVPLLIPTTSSLVISPDGTRLVYVARRSNGPFKLFTRRLDQLNPTELAGTEGAANPVFSPDGLWVGFFAGKSIAKAPVEGGPLVSLAAMPFTIGVAWGDDGLVIGSGIPSSVGLLRMPSAGGEPVPLLPLAKGELFHTNPQILPGGRAVLFGVTTSPPIQETSSIDVVSIADGRRKTLVRGAGSARYVASGHLLYTKRATMFAMPFDIEALEARGSAVAIFDDIAYDAIASGSQFDVSRDGTLVYRRDTGHTATSATTVQWLDRTGAQKPLLAAAGAYRGTPQLSPDGRRIAVAIQEGTASDIWVYDAERDVNTRLTFGGGLFSSPVWSRDGGYVVFGSFAGVLSVRADGRGEPQVLIPSKSIQFPVSFTPDGKRLAYVQNDGLSQIWTVPVEHGGGGLTSGTPERFLTTPFSDAEAVFSPDGRWVAYVSDESGTFEVYVRAFPDGGEKLLISNSGGRSPRWSANSRQLLYREGDRIMSVDYTAPEASFIPQKPRVWATGVRATGGFDLSRDNRMVALLPMTAGEAPGPERSIVFVLNFFDELRRRAPAGR